MGRVEDSLAAWWALSEMVRARWRPAGVCRQILDSLGAARRVLAAEVQNKRKTARSIVGEHRGARASGREGAHVPREDR